MPTIKELETLLKSSEEEMLFWRKEFRKADVEREEYKARLEALDVLDPDGCWPSYSELALMFTEVCNERDALKAENATPKEDKAVKAALAGKTYEEAKS